MIEHVGTTEDGHEVFDIFRTSERKAFKTCQWQWWMAYVRRLQKKGTNYNALWFGQGIHLALERWYIPGKKRGVDPIVTWREYVSEAKVEVRSMAFSDEDADDKETVWVDAGELGEKILGAMMELYEDDSKWEILTTEQVGEVYIPDPDDKSKILCRYVAVFDIVALNLETGDVWLWDHKTARQIKTTHLRLDDQAGAYWAIAEAILRSQGKLKKGERIKGILYNFLMKSPMDERPVNPDGLSCNKPVKKHYVEQLAGLYDGQYAVHGDPQEVPVELTEKGLNTLKVGELQALARKEGLEVFGDPSKKQPSKRFHREEVSRSPYERKKQIQRIGQEFKQVKAVKDGTFAVTKNPGDHCGWCHFKVLCETDERGGDVEEIIEFGYEVHDPYEQYTTGGIQ